MEDTDLVDNDEKVEIGADFS